MFSTSLLENAKIKKQLEELLEHILQNPAHLHDVQLCIDIKEAWNMANVSKV